MTKEIKDDNAYLGGLLSTWIEGGVLTILIYGLGRICELQSNISYHLQETDDKLNK